MLDPITAIYSSTRSKFARQILYHSNIKRFQRGEVLFPFETKMASTKGFYNRRMFADNWYGIYSRSSENGVKYAY